MTNPNSFDPHEAANELAQIMAQMKESFAPVEESARGYRDRLKIEFGWNDAAAQEIAVAYFHLMIRMISSNIQ